jgi:hypothetical protein
VVMIGVGRLGAGSVTRTGAGGSWQLCAVSPSNATHCPAGIWRFEIQRSQCLQRRRYELAIETGLFQEAASGDSRLA